MERILTSYSLAEVTDQYMINRFVRNKKYYPGYLYQAKQVWKELFKTTIWSTQSEWQPLRKGVPYNYIDVPVDMQRLFSVSITDHCGTIIPLAYANYANIVSKPAQNTCGCDACVCDAGICEDIGGLTKITKLLFTINGTDYYETIWIKVCPNGDIIEYREVPTKKYNNFTGDGGDYNNDYNNDYLIENPPFTDYTVVTETFQKILCKLEVKPCGCPANTVDNEELFLQHCGAFCPPLANCRVNRKACQKVYDALNTNGCLGKVKMSECGNKIYYIPPPTFHNQPAPKLPEYLLISYQTTGENCKEIVQVPDFALNAMFLGIDYYSKRFNNSFNSLEKREAKYAWVEGQNDLLLYLSSFSLEKLSSIQDAPILF